MTMLDITYFYSQDLIHFFYNHRLDISYVSVYNFSVSRMLLRLDPFEELGWKS